MASGESKAFDDPGIFVEIPLVNQIRPRVQAWREAGYPGVTSISKRLLDHWNDPEEFEGRRFFFCQLEAIETLIWLAEAPAAERVGIEIPGDGSDFARQCCKMANARNLLVVNDEAHHAWRVNWEAEGKYLRTRDLKDSAQEATVWIGGLDRLQRSRAILACYDFSATPFTPSGKKSSEEALFGWIVSDFGLNDAIESGLVKTPRVKHAFDSKRIHIDELCDPERVLHIDSKVLDQAEAVDREQWTVNSEDQEAIATTLTTIPCAKGGAFAQNGGHGRQGRPAG